MQLIEELAVSILIKQPEVNPVPRKPGETVINEFGGEVSCELGKTRASCHSHIWVAPPT